MQTGDAAELVFMAIMAGSFFALFLAYVLLKRKDPPHSALTFGLIGCIGLAVVIDTILGMFGAKY